MAVLVRDDVRLGERAALGAELRLQLVEEAEVDVDVSGRPGSRTGPRPTTPRRSPWLCPSKNRVRAGS